MDTTPEPPAPRETRPARRTYSEGSRGKSNSTCQHHVPHVTPCLTEEVHTGLKEQ